MSEHTKGRAAVRLIRGSYQQPAQVYVGGKFVAACYGDQLVPDATSIGEAEANAALIAEAFNVAHETGRTPQQLADERAELVSAADAFIYKRTHETLMNLCAILAKVKGPVPS